MSAGICRICGCTELAPCPEGCAWTNATKTECTSCLRGAHVARLFLGIVRKVETGVVDPDPLSHYGADQQQAFVLATRAVLDAVPSPELMTLRAELNALVEWLEQHYPAQLDESRHRGDSLKDTIASVLGARRIVLVGG